MRHVVYCQIFVSVLVATGCRPAPSPPAAETYDDAYGVLRRVTGFYQKVKIFQVDFSQEISFGSSTIQRQSKITVERPNRFAMHSLGGWEGPDVVCNGEHVWMSMPSVKKYTQTEAPQSIDQLVSKASAAGLRPLLEIFSENAYERMMENVRRGDYIAAEKIDDVEVDHLRFESHHFNWDVWITTGDRPLLLQARFELPGPPGSSKPDDSNPDDASAAEASTVSLHHYHNWRFDEPPPGDAFAFEPPPDAEKVDSLVSDGRRQPARDSSPLIGKPAPDAELVLLNGSRLRLSEMQGEKIIVLDFWATWCEYCMLEIPLVDKVADQYRDKDVVLYYVNQREDEATIFNFLADHKLKSLISLDLTGEIGTAFGSEGLPTLAVIDKSGIVQAVHVGFRPDIGETLTEEIEALLAGKDLAAEPSEGSSGSN